MAPYYCINADMGSRHDCNNRNLNQCGFCKAHPPLPEISEERRAYLDHENDEIDLLNNPCPSRA